MRTRLWIAVIVAAALAATVVGQQQDRVATSSDRAPRPATDPNAPPPPGMGPDTKLEWFMMRPGRVRVRDTWNVGRVECRPWDAGPNAEKSWVRVNAIVVRDGDNAGDKVAGAELVLEDDYQDRTFVFDDGQIADLISALDSLDAAGQKLRDPPAGASRRAVWTLNGLEIGMNPHRTGGYLAPMAPDEKSIGLSPDDFVQLKRLLQETRDLLGREAPK